jgi:type IV pilus assembly protein PilC
MLDTVLQRLADFMEKAARLKRRVIGAMIYPVAVLIIASAIIGLLMKFVIPSFIQMFEELEVELPGPTLFLIRITNFVNERYYLLPAIPVGLFIVFKIVASTRIGRIALDWLKFKLPLFGKIVNKAAIARFSRTFGTLIGSGVPILEALNISRDTAGNQVLANAIQNVHDSVREGDPIAAPLGQSNVCDDIVVNMIDVGEETGNLDTMLMKVADTYDLEVDVAVEGLTRLMEPLLVIFLGGVIGFVVIALFMPMIKLMGALS